MSNISQHLLEREELHPEERAEIRDEQEKDLAYQAWCDKRESETEHKLAASDNNGIEF